MFQSHTATTSNKVGSANEPPKIRQGVEALSGGFIPVPQIYRQAQAHLARQQRQLAKKQTGSQNQKKQNILTLALWRKLFGLLNMGTLLTLFRFIILILFSNR